MGGPSHHEPFQSLSPVDWAEVPRDDLKTFLDSIFTEANTIVESVPSPASATSTPTTGRARAKTDSAVLEQVPPPAQPQTPAALEQSNKLKSEWKEIKVNPRENPHDVKVWKLGAKDGKGAWFARRSVHEGLTFDQWKAGLDREFNETMKVEGGPGSGSIRGIGAEKRVEDHYVDDEGHAQGMLAMLPIDDQEKLTLESVFQLSAQFPGPTSPRDFITLLLTTDFKKITPGHPQPLRQYVIVSKPCEHPECPPRDGIIRGRYESVEVIREVPAEVPATKRSASAIDLGTEKNPTPSKSTDGSTSTAIEWLMVTRSDPGGSVPRFMIEKGTPPGIVNDAGKFLDWVTQKTKEETGDTEVDVKSHGDRSTSVTDGNTPTTAELPGDTTHKSTPAADDKGENPDYSAAWSNNGLYGMITGAFGVATSMVSGGLRGTGTGAEEAVDHSDSSESPRRDDKAGDSSPSETSSIRSFASALERSLTEEQEKGSEDVTQSEDKSQDNNNTPHQKELRRLQERRRKLDEKSAKMQERLESRRHGDKEKDAAAMAKVREKHEKEIAKQEAKYKRELKKIEDKREQEERKAEEKRKKAAEREERSNMSLELEKVRTERDVARKEVELLRMQVGELQAQNTSLAARLGKAGGLERGESASSLPGKLERAQTSKSQKS